MNKTQLNNHKSPDVVRICILLFLRIENSSWAISEQSEFSCRLHWFHSIQPHEWSLNSKTCKKNLLRKFSESMEKNDKKMRKYVLFDFGSWFFIKFTKQ